MHTPQPSQHTSHRQSLGRRGEDLAADYIASIGMSALWRNWRCRFGEIDIIAESDDSIVFIEVKTRRGLSAGDPLEAVTPLKLARLKQLIALWFQEQGEDSLHTHRKSARLDVIGILIPGDGAEPMIRHIVGVL